MSPPSLRDLDALLIDLSGDARALQQRAQAELSARGAAIIPQLSAALDDERFGSVGHARILRLMAELGHEAALPAVLAASRRASARRDPVLLAAAIHALGAFRSSDALDELIGHLNGPNSDFAKQAAIVLGQLGERAAIEPLSGLLDRPEAGLRYCVVGALAAIGGDRARELLSRHARRESDPEVLAQIPAALR